MAILNLDPQGKIFHERKVPLPRKALTRKELAIWRLGCAYGFSHEALAKLILELRKR